jgi:hypothetical protein
VITGIEVKGVDRLASTLDDAARQLGDLREAGTEAGRIITSVAAMTAPRRTGALAGSVAAEVVEGGGVVVGSDLIYAPPIHNGWAAHGISPQPFLADALDSSEGQVVEVYAKAVTAAVADVEGV